MLRDHKGWLVERLLSLQRMFGTRLAACPYHRSPDQNPRPIRVQ
jgi:hypothetical protein